MEILGAERQMAVQNRVRARKGSGESADTTVRGDSYQAAIRQVLERVGDRWSLLVLCTLAANGTQRFSVLRDEIESISQRMLSQTLRRLQEDGLLHRFVYPTHPPRVEYALTPLGTSLAGPLGDLARWAQENHRQVLEARRA
jgi:DNA-binding HxlR family transcriptional regulator